MKDGLIRGSHNTAGAKFRFHKPEFFKGYVMDIVYKTIPEIAEDICNKITAAFASIDKQVFA